MSHSITHGLVELELNDVTNEISGMTINDKISLALRIRHSYVCINDMGVFEGINEPLQNEIAANIYCWFL